MAFARTVIESPNAERCIDDVRCQGSPDRLTDIYEGLKWRLARQPEVGYRLPTVKPDTYVVHSYHWNVAAIVAVYRFDADAVHIIDLNIVGLPSLIGPLVPDPVGER